MADDHYFKGVIDFTKQREWPADCHREKDFILHALEEFVEAQSQILLKDTHERELVKICSTIMWQNKPKLWRMLLMESTDSPLSNVF